MDVSRLHLIMTLLKRRMSREIRWKFLPRLRNFPLCRFTWNDDRVLNSFRQAVDRPCFNRVSWLITVLREFLHEVQICEKRKRKKILNLQKNIIEKRREHLDIQRKEKNPAASESTRIIKSRNLHVRTRILRFPFQRDVDKIPISFHLEW